jgi:hypothetical protein
MGGYDAVAVTPTDGSGSFTFASGENAARYLYIGTTGDVTVITSGGEAVLFKAHPVGYLWARVRNVQLTGTGASNILAIK